MLVDKSVTTRQEVCMQRIGQLGARLLEAFVPKVDAFATCGSQRIYCYCSGGRSIYRSCWGCTDGSTGCGPCTIKGGRC